MALLRKSGIEKMLKAIIAQQDKENFPIHNFHRLVFLNNLKPNPFYLFVDWTF
jgi:hypothetical protein